MANSAEPIQFSTNQITWSRLLIQIHTLSGKQCRAKISWLLEANWSECTLFVKTDVFEFSRIRVKRPYFQFPYKSNKLVFSCIKQTPALNNHFFSIPLGACLMPGWLYFLGQWIHLQERNCQNCFVSFLFVYAEVLQPSETNGVLSSMVNLPNHTYTGQA